MSHTDPQQGPYLRSGDVARLLHVSPKTVARWANEGRLPYARTLGGHRRFRPAAVRGLIEALDRVEHGSGAVSYWRPGKRR